LRRGRRSPAHTEHPFRHAVRGKEPALSYLPSPGFGAEKSEVVLFWLTRCWTRPILLHSSRFAGKEGVDPAGIRLVLR
jgi:hypothetical protein